ncbi:MAG: SMC-Scp complex subunit ScpB [Planctomycetota bacterium]|nr:SMC-Scp complex subunit ScpB [Planctomycetota bacterium]
MAARQSTFPRRWHPAGSRTPPGMRPPYAAWRRPVQVNDWQTNATDRRLWRSPLVAEIEALLFCSPDPMPLRKLEDLLPGRTGVAEALNTLRNLLAADDSAFDLMDVAGGFKLFTRTSVSHWLAGTRPKSSTQTISEALRDTLSVVAYRQPVTRATIEAIKGVSAADHLKQLLDLGLIRIAGRETTLGRPVLYRTSRAFLEWGGMASLADLPPLPSPTANETP